MNSPRLANLPLRRLFLIAVVTVLGLLTKVYVGPFSNAIQDHGGGFFYVVFFVLLFALVLPEARPHVICLAVVAATCLIEFLQLSDIAFLHEARKTAFGKLLLGTTFSLQDFPFYLGGGVAGYILLKRTEPKRNNSQVAYRN